ncbi:hypothetical protein TNCV_4405711 [Trichonephila clavipes]|uniref:Uncharacterized protein n=1 Tax=Trichonephila clavipes TaxID=2585209 RepID=A0A8X6S3Q6_TRICX|nr:hypothetical protein TNCV_4405711 [Trichonephila clavipes]
MAINIKLSDYCKSRSPGIEDICKNENAFRLNSKRREQEKREVERVVKLRFYTGTPARLDATQPRDPLVTR